MAQFTVMEMLLHSLGVYLDRFKIQNGTERFEIATERFLYILNEHLVSLKVHLAECKQFSEKKDAERSRQFQLLVGIRSALLSHRDAAWARELYEKIDRELNELAMAPVWEFLKTRAKELGLPPPQERPPLAQSPSGQADQPHIQEERPPGAS